MNVRSVLGPVIFAGAFLPVPALVGGQTPARFEVVPRLGVYAPTREVGPAAHAAGPWYLRLERIDAAPAFELEGRVTWPGAHFATRLVGLATLPANVSGFFDCYPGLACPAILLPSDAEAMVLAAALDVVVSPLDPGGSVRPFAFAGFGVKRYRFEWSDAATFVMGGKEAESGLTLRAGVGAELQVWRQSFRVEVADWWSDVGPKVGEDPGILGLSAPRRHVQHDLAVSLGWRLLDF